MNTSNPAFRGDGASAALASQVEFSIERLDRWVRANGYRAYDPGDGQLSYLRVLTFGQLRLERVLTAAVLRTPLNIRPLLGIRPHTSTKGMGYMAWGYLRRFRTFGRGEDADAARNCLDWLVGHRSSGYAEFSWGNEFTFTTRAGRIPAGEPTIVWSGLIGQAFIEAYETLGNRRDLEIAASVCDWIKKLPREQTDRGSCLSYVASHQVSIHNSNMLGAALLARVAQVARRDDLLGLAADAMRYSCERQNDDGAWYYGESPKYHWIDNFHTGYNLDSLRRYRDSTRDAQFNDVLKIGFDYFKRHFFEPDGRPKYMHDRSMPTDIQCAAQSIDTLAYFADLDDEALPLAGRCAAWTIEHMQDAAGYFHYRDLGWKKIRTPMFHWGQGTMFKALAHLASRLVAAGAARPPAIRGDRRVSGSATTQRYVLVTPARNEAQFIGNTIHSVVAQTVRPYRWVVVSDGSTDGTDDIVRQFALEHDWIELIRMPEHRDRTFAAKANCFNGGYEKLEALSFEIIGNLDADITLSPDHFEFLMARFAERPTLGVAGTPYVEDSGQPGRHTYAHEGANLEHVSGACQLFRRECFESIGGYVPIEGGAIDWIAVTTARMMGWQTRTFVERVSHHHRKIGTAESSRLKARFHYGRKAYYVGGHPLWELLRAVFQMRTSPYVAGGVCFAAGYLWAALTRLHRPVSAELMAFHRNEQMTRLKRFLRLA